MELPTPPKPEHWALMVSGSLPKSIDYPDDENGSAICRCMVLYSDFTRGPAAIHLRCDACYNRELIEQARQGGPTPAE